MKKIIIKLLIRWYVNYSKDLEVVKMHGIEELRAYTFQDQELTEKLIKTMLTAQTLWHFEAQSDEERLITKGAALVLKTLKNTHDKAIEIYDHSNPDKSLVDWIKYKRNHRVN